MATLKVIQTRLKSVKSIQKITKSMKMVSASKLSRAERELSAARPLGKGTQTFFDKTDIAKTELTDKPDIQKSKLIIAVSSDRGLCGAIHTQVAKAVKAELLKSPENAKVICIGDKSRALLHRSFGGNIILLVSDVGRLPPLFVDASKIAIFCITEKFDEGKIFYNKFNSLVSYTVSQMSLFSEIAILRSPKSVIYDSLDSDVLDGYLEFSLASLLFYSMKENACSEQASRMAAMDNATKNAGEMIDMLTLKFNRTRQAVITRELIEIISGAAALK